MCGIVGYIGGGQAIDILVDGLTQLEYRGYDSAGVAVLGASGVKRIRARGRVRDLEAALPKRVTGKVGIGHTRWATHGAPSEANAHPHADSTETVFVVHNGIIDNARELRAELASEGVVLASDTDTEALAHLVGRAPGDTLEAKVRAVLPRISGTYALAVLHARYPDRIVVARNGSPLILGVADKQMFIASDISAVVRHTSSVVHLDDGECATVTASGFHLFDAADARALTKSATTVDVSADELELGNHAHFMAKEIGEQPASLERMLSGRLDERFATARLDGLNLDARALRRFKRVKILGCGSAFYMGQLGGAMIEELARIPADAEAASEFRYRNPIIEPDTLYVAVSQSGETADTAFAVQEVKRKGGTIVGLINVVGSTIAREVSGGIYLHAGPEVSVASTKANTHMAVGFALLALALGRVRDLSITDGTRIVRALRALPAQVAEILDDGAEIAEAAKFLATAPSLFFIGRARGYPTAREGAQKFKEISYRHAEAYQASELKHGPLALISPDLPTVAIIPDDELLDRNIGALHEITARGGEIVAITNPGVEVPAARTVLRVPKSAPELDPILHMIPTQLLAYHAALSLGLNIDRPRNLAKSVTVE